MAVLNCCIRDSNTSKIIQIIQPLIGDVLKPDEEIARAKQDQSKSANSTRWQHMIYIIMSREISQ